MMQKYLLFTITVCLITIIFVAIYAVYRNMIITEKKYEFDQKMLQAQSLARVTTSYDDAFKIVDKMLMVSTTNKIKSLNLTTKTPEQLSLILDDVIVEISVEVLTGISEPLTRQLNNYVSREYLTKYITDNCKTLLVIGIESVNKK